MNDTTRLERIGHRGAPKDFRENTLPSFRRAVELGADAIELDVHVTADGVPVVHHDAALPRGVAPSRLRGASIAALAARDLRTVRFRQDTGIPELHDVVSELARQVFLYVELKSGNPEALVDVLRPHSRSVAVHSFDHAAMAQLARIAPEIPRGVLVEDPETDIERLLGRTGARDLWPAYHLVRQPFMAAAERANARVIPWTVNRASVVKRLVGLRVAGICTNDLTLLAPALQPR